MLCRVLWDTGPKAPGKVDRPLELLQVRSLSSLSQESTGRYPLWVQKPDEPVVLVTIGIQEDYGRGPFHTESAHHGLVFIKINLQRNETLLNGEQVVESG